MRREEFMRQLEALLSDISEEERREALAYYRSYFEDAGEENEERILRELESPQKVAATIKEDLRMEQGNGTEAGMEHGYEGGAYTEHGYEDGRREADGRYWVKADTRQNRNRREEERIIKIALIVIAVVLTSPIWGGAVFGVFGTVIGLVISFVVAAFALYVIGGVLIGIGIGQLAAGGMAVGFGLMGAAMFVWAIALLMTIFCVWACGKFIPWLCDAVSKLWRKVFPGKERA